MVAFADCLGFALVSALTGTVLPTRKVLLQDGHTQYPETLFGPLHRLKAAKSLLQPGQSSRRRTCKRGGPAPA